HPQPLNFEDPRFEYQGIGNFGGRGGRQNAIQTRFSLRDDVTFSGLQLAGDHTLKVGLLAEFLDYTMIKNFRFQPVYRFREQENFAFPWQAALAFGEPDMASDNQAFGIYGQDQWDVNDALALSLGLRWDYETKMLDTDYVTPDYVRTALTGFAPENFFSDGNDRQSPMDNFAPRLGATYDLFQNGRTVLFAGAGRYYDRVLFNELVDVRFKENYRETFFEFSADGRPGTIRWDPKYLTKEGLQELQAAGGGRHEVWLFDNNSEVPYADQWNLGVRQSFGGMVGSLSYGSVRGYNNLQWSFAPFSLNANGTCCNVPSSHPGAVLMSNQDEETYYDAIYATLDRPMSRGGRYGFNLAYTYAEAETMGDERGSVTFPPPGTTTHATHPTSGHEKHRLVANGMLRVPWDVLLSTLVQYGSGPQIVGTRIVSNIGWPAGERFVHHGEGRSWSAVDLRGEKTFNLGRTGLGIVLEAFNLLNTDRYSCYQDFEGMNGNPDLLEPGCITQGSQRRFQAGFRVEF
ncbi:MAG: TonB-dependent receptor domain-containing protein, partial [Thermoanaerobaculia bacterium]